jgi:hypothetical protein
MRPRSNPGNHWSAASHDHRKRSSRSCPSRLHPTSPRERTKTSITVTTSAPSVQRTSSDAQRVCGLAAHVGLSSTWAASRSGQPTRDPPLLVSRLRTAKHRHRGSGAALDVICRKMFSRRTSHAGVRRNWIRNPSQVCHRSLAGRPALDHESCPRSAHIPVA